jgi:hypothetical protein
MSKDAFNVRFRGQSGHGFLRCECLLLTQSGHFALPNVRFWGQDGQMDGLRLKPKAKFCDEDHIAIA